MKRSPLKLSILFLALLNNMTSFGMLALYNTKNRKNLGLAPLSALAMQKNKPFNFPALPSVLQLKISSETDPACAKKLRETCKFLYENISLQTPQVWNLIYHSLQCIDRKHLNVLILKATLCTQKSALEKIRCHIKENNFFECGKDEYNYEFRDHCGIKQTGFFNYPADLDPRTGHSLLIIACCTNDTNIVANVIKSSKKFINSEINLCLAISITYENPTIIKMLCDLKQNTSHRIGHYGSTDFTVFFDNAVRADKINAFESLISYNTSELNETLFYSNTYLDSLYRQHKNQKNLQDYINIVEKYGGKHQETINEELAENLAIKYFS